MISKNTLSLKIKELSKQLTILKDNYKRIPVKEQFGNEYMVFAGVTASPVGGFGKPLWYINGGPIKVGTIDYREDLEAKVFDKNDLKELYKAILATKGGKFSLTMAKEGTMTFEQAIKKRTNYS